MKLKANFSPQAKMDLQEIRDYIASDNVQAANKLVRDILALIEDHCGVPEIGTPRDDLKTSLRAFTHSKNYVVLYEFDSDALHVLRVVHTARDFERFF